MDINKNNINKIPKVFDNFIGKTNTYIPALHQERKDTFVSTTKNTSFKGNIVTKEDVLSKLNKVELPEKTREEVLSKLETQNQITLANKFLSTSKLYENPYLQRGVSCWLSKYDDDKALKSKMDIIEKYLSDENLINSPKAQKLLNTALMFTKNESASNITNRILSNPDLYENDSIEDNFSSILTWSNYPDVVEGKLAIIDKFESTPELYKNPNIKNIIGKAIQKANNSWASKTALTFLSSPRLYENEGLQKYIPNIISSTNTEGKHDVVNWIFSSPDLYENEELIESIERILFQVKTPEDLSYSEKLFEFIQSGEISSDLASNLIKNSEKIRYKQVRKLRETVPAELFESLSKFSNDLVVASTMLPLYKKSNINEIPLSEKRAVLRGLIQNNAELFIFGRHLKEHFPLIPQNREEYCALLPTLVKSLGIETKPLSEAQVESLNANISDLSSNISQLSEKEFHNLKIGLTYSKNNFIKDTIDIVKELPKQEQQKVFDYFGFELKENTGTRTGYSITGYPVNINNGAKLAQITDTKTKEVIELLRPKVIDFSENNPVVSNNETVSELLNNILPLLPELNTTIGRRQHGAHDYDVFKHSLKVMQKITQNPQFETLNESDKKIILLASLFHDITKAEGKPDPNHATECSFDAFYISKKLNLTQEEQTKLYTLIDTHEWLKDVNSPDISDAERTRRMQSVAFDLQNNNIFQLSKIFTEADIKAIKNKNGLYGAFGPALEQYSPLIEEYIKELKNTQPILPTTKLPNATEIENKITTVNPDNSTNIKGVYKQDGLIIVKYNEVENWEELGFKKGNSSHGIQVTNPIDGNIIDTGTIKFIAHGFDDASQLSNFNAFTLPDSDALLSVSYMERPESKYRLFRPQGVLLDVSSNNIYGGGESDAGSGYKKNISEFKLNYIFGGERQQDRVYISNLIKETLSLNDEEYIEFVKTNRNKSMNEIEPVEAREKLVKCFSLVNSNTRQGNREYNEMYISNPKVQGVYAYSQEDSVGDISTFIENQPTYLKDYAKQNDLPFFVFGD